MNSAVPPPSPPPPRQPGSPLPPKPPALAEATFNSALERPPAEREAFVAQACGDDTVLIAEVRGLLDSLREHPSLAEIACPLMPGDQEVYRPVAEFWPAYDAKLEAEKNGK